MNLFIIVNWIKKLILVDGGWSEWEAFSECSVSCGGGEKTRSRTCTNPEPANGGADCEGDYSETMACNEQGCPGNSIWLITYNWGSNST